MYHSALRHARLTPRISAILLGVVTLCLSACSVSHWPAAAPALEKRAIGVFDINSLDPALLEVGGNLRLPIVEPPGVFNPLHVASTHDFVAIARAIYPTAFITTPDGTIRTNTDYFTSVTMISSNPEVISYKINPQAVWSDGTPITWQDIASQVDALSGDKRFKAASTSGYEQASVTRGSDDREALVTFDKPYTEWQALFSGHHVLLPRGMTSTPEAFNRGEMGPSAGPFMISSFERTEDSFTVTVTRNPKWWGDPPRLESITYVAMEPDDRLQALKDGVIDATPLEIAPELWEAQRTDGISVRHAPERRYRLIMFNGGPGKILENFRMRQALAYAIDRDAIVNATQQGLAADPAALRSHLFTDTAATANTDIDNTVEFAPLYAGDALDTLGWTMSGGVRKKDGRVLTVRVLPTAFSKADFEALQLITDYLDDIGVHVEVIEYSWWNDAFDILLADIYSDGYPLHGLYEAYGTLGRNNSGRIGSPDLDTRINAAATELDPARARVLATDIDRVLFEEVHSLPLGLSPGVVAVRDTVANYGAFGMSDIDYTAIGFTR